MLDIYEGNRTFVLDAETKQLIGDIEKITKLQSPYSEIHKLPELIERFMKRFVEILEEECVPIRAAIEADKAATLADLERRSFKAQFERQVHNEFDAMLERLSRTNNILVAVGMPTESDRLKQRFVQSFINEEQRIANANKPAGDNNTPPPAPVPKTKPVTMKSLFAGTTQIKSEADIDRLLAEMRAKLKAQLDGDTTIHIV